MRWACIGLPQLALDGVLRRCRDPQQPWVLLSGPAQRRLLHSVNPAARALGLRRGMRLASAQALCPDFAAEVHSAEDELRWQRLLAAWAYRFSSQVSLQYPGCLLVEIRGSLRLFGPWPRLEAQLREELSALGFCHRIAAAPNPEAARALARAHDGMAIEHPEPLRRALGQLSVQQAGFEQTVCDALQGMGLRCLRQVWALPRDTLARRFPRAVLQHLDALIGARETPLQCYRPPDRFDLRIELGHEVESSRALLFPLRRLTADLAAFLAGRDGGVQRFVLQLEHEGRAATEVTVGLLAAERDPALLFELARSRLEQARVPAAVRALALRADELPPFVPVHRELFDERPQQSVPWAMLRERLRARLGEQALHGLQVQADHRPEQACSEHDVTPSAAAVLPSTQGARPAWLLPTPIPLRGAPPELLAGPERIESGWWDGGDVRRDYYIARLPSGQQAWVFRPVGGGPLMLHGWFA